MPTIEVEEWMVKPPECQCSCEHCANSPRERHIFLEGDQRGQAYVIGYDPGKIPQEALRVFLAQFGVALP